MALDVSETAQNMVVLLCSVGSNHSTEASAPNKLEVFLYAHFECTT
jgi:hypothetical protein